MKIHYFNKDKYLKSCSECITYTIDIIQVILGGQIVYVVPDVSDFFMAVTQIVSIILKGKNDHSKKRIVQLNLIFTVNNLYFVMGKQTLTFGKINNNQGYGRRSYVIKT